MKNFKFILPILLLTVFFSSCVQDELEDINQEPSVIDFSEIGKKKPTNGSFDDFITYNYSRLNEINDDLEIILFTENNINYYVVEPITASQNNGRVEFETLETTCKTCRSAKCVRNELNSQIGDGNSDLDISVRPKTTFGVQTSVEICTTRIVEGG